MKKSGAVLDPVEKWLCASQAGVPASVSQSRSPSAASDGPASADDTGTGTAHGCGGRPGQTVTLIANPDGFAPSLGCVRGRRAQRLRVVNNTNGFDQAGETITLRMRGLPVIIVPRGKSATYPKPISTYLAPAQHHGTCSCGSELTFVIWVLP